MPTSTPARPPSSNGRWAAWFACLRPLTKVFMSLADQAVISGVRFATSVMIGRFAGQEEMGFYSISFGFLLMATCMQEALVCAPFTLFQSRETGTNRGRYQGSVLAQVLVLSALASILFGLSWYWLNSPGDASGLRASLGALALATPFILFREFARRVELARLHVGRAFMLDASSAILQLALMAWLLQAGILRSAYVYLAIGASGALPTLAWLAWSFSGNRFESDSLLREARRHWGVARWSFLAQVFGTLHWQGVVWMLAWSHGASAAGLLAACNYVILFLNPLALGVCNSISPLAVHTYTKSGLAQVRLLIGLTMAGMGGVIGVFTWAAYTYADAILLAIYNKPSYQSHNLLMLLLGINMLFGVVHMMNDQGVWAIERPEWLLRSTLLTVSITLLLAIPLTLLCSKANDALRGAALSMIAGRLIGLGYQTGMFFCHASHPQMTHSPSPSEEVLSL